MILTISIQSPPRLHSLLSSPQFLLVRVLPKGIDHVSSSPTVTITTSSSKSSYSL